MIMLIVEGTAMHKASKKGVRERIKHDTKCNCYYLDQR